MSGPPPVGTRVIIDWGRCKGREGVVVAHSTTQRGMVVVEYEARAAEKEAGIEVGQRVSVYLHWKHLAKPKYPARRG